MHSNIREIGACINSLDFIYTARYPGFRSEALMNHDCKAWIARNRDALMTEYGDYRTRHDYSPDGTYWATFEAWAANEYAAEMRERSFNTRCPRCGGSPTSCQQWPEGLRSCEEA